MPTISDPNTVKAIAQEYISNGRNKPKALITVGYSESYANSGKGTRLYGKKAVKEAIAVLEAKMGAEVGRTVQSLDLMYQQAYDKSLSSNQPSAMVSAVTGIARLYGMDKGVTITDTADDDDITPAERAAAEAGAKVMKLKLSRG